MSATNLDYAEFVEVIIDSTGAEIGEIYMEDGDWGCLHYESDNDYDGMDTREEALSNLALEHSKYSDAVLVFAV